MSERFRLGSPMWLHIRFEMAPDCRSTTGSDPGSGLEVAHWMASDEIICWTASIWKISRLAQLGGSAGPSDVCGSETNVRTPLRRKKRSPSFDTNHFCRSFSHVQIMSFDFGMMTIDDYRIAFPRWKLYIWVGNDEIENTDLHKPQCQAADSGDFPNKVIRKEIIALGHSRLSCG